MKTIFDYKYRFKTIDLPESVEISPDNRSLVCFLTNDTTTLRNISNGEVTHTIEGLGRSSISPDGKYLIGRWEDKKMTKKMKNKMAKKAMLKLKLMLYHFPEMIPIKTIDTKRNEITSLISSVQFSPRGEYLSCVIKDSELGIYYFDIFELPSYEKIKTIKSEHYGIISHNWSYLIQVDNFDFIIRDLWTGNIINRINGDCEYLWTLNTSPNENYIVCGYGENLDTDYENKKDWYLKAWEIRSGKSINIYEGSKYGPNSAVFSLNGKYLVAGWETGAIFIWNFLSGEKLLKIRGFNGYISSMSKTKGIQFHYLSYNCIGYSKL